MQKAFAFLGLKKSSKPFKDYYSEWFNALKNVHLPQLRRAMLAATVSPAILSAHVDAMQRHFIAYYEALDLAALNDVAQALFPEWRNSLEKPFLWLGDLHPYLFTNLLRSFLEEDDDEGSGDEEEEDGRESRGENTGGQPWYLARAWRSPPRTLTARIDQIECGLRLMVPALAARARHAQAAFVDRVGREWGRCEGRSEDAKSAVEESVAAEMEELVDVFVDANRLRRSVLSDIVNATDVYQAALFLESLAQFLVGFKDKKFLAQCEKFKMPVT
ncbi:PREDICTED: protein INAPERTURATE POLLEN1 [Ipomoea nil]|uniref:protein INAPERTURATE POLLEN1 n=1 Tax=Ipomoea nil TaxID=35883 RepID=UPI000900D06F|nr:PREDICTED: protein INAPERTURATE POLLEN1 [Ipomoea nil]